jgi:hypothetical protein
MEGNYHIMVCKECKNKSIHRGIKQIECYVCGKIAVVNSAYQGHICSDCSDEQGVCQFCGDEIAKHKKKNKINKKNSKWKDSEYD